MKTITLKDDGTFKHQWLETAHGKDNIPQSAIQVTNAVFMELSQNPQNKRYDIETKTVVDNVAPFDFDNSKAIKLSQINSSSTKELAVIVSQYTQEEIDSWPVQESEANAWTRDNTASTPLIDAMVANRPSIDKPTLVNRILANAQAYKAASGMVIGKKQAFEDALNALDPETAAQADIDAIVVDYS